MRRFAVLILSAVIVAACGNDDANDQATSSTEPSEPVTETSEAPSESAAGTVDDLYISQVFFDGDNIGFVLANPTDTPITVDSLWVCNRPNYVEISLEVPANGESLVADPALNLDNFGSEVALYRTNAFGDPDAMIDYVVWGGDGGRTSVAVEAGLWPEGDFVDNTGNSFSATETDPDSSAGYALD